ncbi:von Willebrand factor type A domain containing protein [Acanthamoeba castellanii str. Neff]|uniref:von Willebrand factor type A domain containing protein n=1 Tax=Acanthamoeba castellanii (strain ATCC 30010 / Neff) TaxID=1257118 RepID=L8GG01_ACACF|nr:von Willebrand factor type A domain containing protein [Acanthamoeba castellanii str. Neff]ELR11799.1 von Willebrand factor type A domain containing protein [Acanthamoeba castellanii str. Neff]
MNGTARFKFKQEECSLYGFEAIVDDQLIVGEIKEKEEALNASGGRGFLLAQDDKIAGAFLLNVGNLPPGKECVITFRYVSELTIEGEFVRMNLPITRLPIFGNATTTTTPTGHQSDEAQPKAAVKDGLHVTISADMPAPVHAVECPSGHQLTSTITGNTARLQFDSKTHASSTGLVVLLGQLESRGEPQAVAEVDPVAGSAVAMVSIVPQLDHLRDADVIAELLFVVDRSGSMSGGRIDQAKNALALFFHSLPVGTRFNVIGFGSHYVKLFPSSRVYDDETLEQANQHVAAIRADLGGTQLLEPLRDVLSSPSDPKYPRQVFVLTDGEVGNTNEVIECVRKHARDTRVFALGIGSNVSMELVNGLAKAGRGYAEYVVSGERLEAKVLRQLKRALQPPVIEYGSAAKGEGKDDGVVVQAHTPDPLPAVVEGECVIASFFNTSDTALIKRALSGAVLKAKTDVEGREDVVYKVEPNKSIKEGQLLHRRERRSSFRRQVETKESR